MPARRGCPQALETANSCVAELVASIMGCTRSAVLAILVAVVPLSALSAPADCETYFQSRSSGPEPDDRGMCYCGSDIAHLEVTAPPGLRVDAVCDLRIDTGPDFELHWIDLTREHVTLDSTTHGRYPNGWAYLSGTMTLSGTVWTEEGPAGSLWFGAKSDRRGPFFWEHHLKELDLADEDFEKFRAPALDVTEGRCWEAEATVRVHDPVVLLGETDEAGTTAKFDVVRTAEFAPCKDRSDPVRPLVAGQPQDVAALIMRIVGCAYWQLETPYAEADQKQEQAAELAKLNCRTLPDDETRILAAHPGVASVVDAINAAKALE